MGLLLARWIADLMAAFPPPSPLPLALEPRLDLRAWLFALGVTGIAALLSAVAPVLHLVRADLWSGLRDDPAARGWRTRAGVWRGGLVAGQVALSVALLVCAGLFMRSLQREMAVDAGFDPRDRWAVSLDLGGSRLRPETAVEFHRELLERVRALPSVEDCSLAQYLPPQPGGSTWSLEERELGVVGPSGLLEGTATVDIDVNAVGPAYFRTMGIPLRGRDFTEEEGLALKNPLTLVVNQALADRLWPGLDPLGRTMRLAGPTAPPFTVVGVAPNGRYRSLREAQKLYAYWAAPLTQSRDLVLLVHTRPGSPSPLREIRAIVRGLDASAVLFDAKTLDQHLGESLLPGRLAAVLFTAFSAAALLVAGLGLYGLLAFAVALRTREIGVRLALGAAPADVRRLILGEGLRLGAIGVAAGVTLAAAAGRSLEGMIFGVGATDPATYTAVLVVTLIALLLASWIPGHRAASVQPAAALRHE